MNGLLLGIAAGAASALLFAAVTSGGALGTPLFFMSALPVAIVTIGWGTLAGIIAVLAGLIGLWVFVSWKAALLHALVIAGPMAFYGYLVGLGRPLDPEGRSFEWYPLGRVFTVMVLITAATIVGVGMVVGFDIHATASDVADMLVAMAQASGEPGAPTREDLLPALLVYMRLMPFALGMFWLVLTAFNLWLGGRVVRLSGRLKRGNDSIAETLSLPLWMVGLFVGAALLASLDGSIGLIAGVIAGSAGMGFAMVGFAVLHVFLRGNPAAPLILGVTYGATFVLSIPLIPLVIAGILDGPLGLRAKRLNQRPGA
ncbi:hypothetical protein [Pleomorphomonas sp. JP5]|uniref:hypothetical protein n=1 Tax=Pleomorphomonas sp. JP5 TaxID=2942998 RepID=UPI0020438BE7|nr:hypothetical protein [Pleomorphomonas sp. JP5]MCM5560398.1 hypothetical protein [Pleomorphomonas sp. JP5]